MRTVKYKTWVMAIPLTSTTPYIPGKWEWADGFAYFHNFSTEGNGTSGDSFEVGPVVIIELQDGSVQSVGLDKIQFIK